MWRSRLAPHEKVFGVEAINGKHRAVIPALQLDWRDVNYNHLFLPVLILICTCCVWPNFVLMKLAFSVKFRGLECSTGDNFLSYPARPALPIQHQTFDCVSNDFHPLFSSCFYWKFFLSRCSHIHYSFQHMGQQTQACSWCVWLWCKPPTQVVKGFNCHQ